MNKSLLLPQSSKSKFVQACQDMIAGQREVIATPRLANTLYFEASSAMFRMLAMVPPIPAKKGQKVCGDHLSQFFLGIHHSREGKAPVGVSETLHHSLG